jgi:uncharacterized protein
MKSESPSESFRIFKQPFNSKVLQRLEDIVFAKSLWPMVYIISNDKEVYIGESTNTIARMGQHLANDERRKLTSLLLIGSSRFNKSATLDLESYLIKYMSGDAKFTLQNGNAGLALHKYYQRDEYLEIFSQVWDRLMSEKLAGKTLKEIDNSNFFKYSPYKSLTEDQYSAVESVFKAISGRSNGSIFIGGSAGTGKTILAVFMMKLLKTDLSTILDTGDIEGGERKTVIADLKLKYPDPRVALVVPMPSLRNTLKKVFRTVKGLSADMVIGPSEVARNRFDVLIIDEAHRLRRRVNLTNFKSFDDNNRLLKLPENATELDWIVKQSTFQVFFYDPAQSIKPTDVSKDDFYRLAKKARERIELKSQLRVLGGKDYIDFVDRLLNVSLQQNAAQFRSKEYEFYLFDSLPVLIDRLQLKEKEVELCRLVAGFSWPWKSKKNSNAVDIEIDGLRLRWNSDVKEWINTRNALYEVGCIHTTQGYDLNYAGVIFGKEITYDSDRMEIVIDSKLYYDKNGKNGIRDINILKSYVINIYKTLMFRGIRGTYVYVCDEKLREYFRKHIPSANDTYIPKILPLEKVRPFINCVPLYELSAAAGSFSDPQNVSDCEWVELPLPHLHKEDHFVCRVVGESMNKIIPNGSWCLFRRDPSGSREGKIVLVEHRNIQDDIGSGYTVKEYHSQKSKNSEGWKHTRITLSPLSHNSEFKEIILNNDDEVAGLKVSGVFVRVVG